MRNIKMTIQYDGSRYKGWQKQNIKGTNVSTIQDKIEKVLSKMTGEEIQVIGCGRTDTGVHADKYIANFKTNSEKKLSDISKYLHEFLPEDISVTSLSEASDSIDRYKSLKRLGASEKDINKTIFIQTLVYFSLPVILAFIHSVIGIKVANDFVSVYNKPDIMGSSLITAGIFMIVYIIYFYITYSGYKNIVKNKIHIK